MPGQQLWIQIDDTVGKQVWIQTDGVVRGPILPPGLRDLVRSGRVRPDTLISLDKARWVPARKVNGLFERLRAEPDAGTLPPAMKRTPPDSVPPQQKPAPGQGTPQTAHIAALRFPIIRIQHTLSRIEVIAIYETHILKGTRFRASIPVTEEMCHPAGEPRLRRVLRRVKSIEFTEISDLREVAPKKVKNPRSQNHIFIIKTLDRRRLKFSIPTSQATNVRNAFSSKLADRYWVGRSRLCDGLSTTFLIVIGLITCVGLLVVLPILLWKYLTRNRRDWKPVREVASAIAQPSLAAPKAPSRVRKPTLSKGLGWTLKALGIAYWIMIASPLTDGLGDYIDIALKNKSYQKNMLWSLIWAPAPLLIYAGYRLCQRRYEPDDRRDTRKPILFLRPFEDDSSTSLQPPGPLASFSGVRAKWVSPGVSAVDQGGRTRLKDLLLLNHPVRLLRMVVDYGVETSEESLVRYFQSFGPVIAIGKPGERLATPGADRMYVDDNCWQAAVRCELQRSQAVVVQPGLSAGVRWELNEIRAKVDPHRVLLCLVSFWRNPQAYEELESVIGESLRVELPRVVPFLTHHSFLYFDHGWIPRLQELSYKNPALWPLTADAADLVYTLQPFVQGIHGGEREMPRRPRWNRGIGTSAATAAAFLLALVIAIIPVLTVHTVAQYVVGAFVSPSAPQSGPEPPPEQQFLDIVNRSPRTTLEGRAVPYRFEVPEGLLKLTPENALIEHWRKSPDGRMMVQIVAHDQREDLSDLAKGRLEKNSGEGIDQATLKSTRTVSHAGVDWVESQIVAKLKTGETVRETARGTTGPGGTVLVYIQMLESPVSDPTYERLTDDILQSFRFFERSGPDVKPPSPAL